MLSFVSFNFLACIYLFPWLDIAVKVTPVIQHGSPVQWHPRRSSLCYFVTEGKKEHTEQYYGFTFITTGCLIREDIFIRADVYTCSTSWHEGGNICMILSVASVRSVGAPTAEGRLLNQNLMHSCATGKDQHSRLFTARTSTHNTGPPHSFACPHTEQPGHKMISKDGVFWNWLNKYQQNN